jgi:hypothetical protein
VDGAPPTGERERDPAGSDPELERTSTAGKLGQQVHDRIDDLGANMPSLVSS